MQIILASAKIMNDRSATKGDACQSKKAGDSQSLIQLQREYCNKHQCLRCRFGNEFLKK